MTAKYADFKESMTTELIDFVQNQASGLSVADVDRLYDEISARGAVVQLPPTNQTWGTREIAIRDPDGNVLGFATKQLSTDAA